MTDAYILNTQRPQFDVADAVGFARDLYDLTTTARELPSERDQNFHLTGDGGVEYVLKISGSAEPSNVLDLQNRALEWIAAHGTDVRAPRLVATSSGEPMRAVKANGLTHWVRLLTYLPGRVLADVRPHDDQLLREIGRSLGGLDRALEEFSHAAAGRELYWDLTRAPDEILHHRDAIREPERRALVDAVVDRWDGVVKPVLPELRRGIIYNDANDYNVIVGGPPAGPPHVAGFVDFGDLLESALVCEPAIAAAYALLDERDPLAAAAAVIGGYHEVLPLAEDELDVLPTLVAARLAVSVCVSAQRRLEEPGNDYLTVSERPAWDALHRLAPVHHRLARAVFRSACGLEPVPSSRAVVGWLEEHGDETAPVIDPDPRTAPTVTLDLSVGSLELEDPIGLAGTEAFCDVVRDRMSAVGAAVGIGRYDEPRIVYAEEAFGASLTGSPARRTIHMGVDLFVPAGAPVRAPLDARVQSLRDNAGHLDYGPTVILEHAPDGGPRFYSLYGHLAPDCLAALRPGQAIAKGDVFASVGAFEHNGSWPPHLHFQVVTDLLDREGEFPGVAAPSERPIWRSLSPDPNLVLRIPGDLRASEDEGIDALRATRQQVLGPSLSLAYDDPLHIVRGRGTFLYDADGTAYLDCVNNVCHVGHCHPRVVRAAQLQMAVLNTNTRYLHEHILRYAERLTATLPEPLRVCYFVCSGSEANELALRIARAHTGRNDLVVLDGAYHGNTAALVDASPYKFAGPGGSGPPPHVHRTVMPDDYRGPYRRDDPECGSRYARHVRQAIESAQDAGREVGAFLCESLLGCGGQIELPPGYLAGAYTHARDAGAVCIADEVQVGFGRVGTHFWGFETQDVIPDIVTLGKPIGNGHPLAAVVTTPELAASFDTGMEYFNTFGGNPVACFVGLAVLDVIRDEGLQERARRVGTRLKAGLRALMEEHPVVGDVRGRGLFLGVELVSDPAAKTPAPHAAAYVVERMKRHGILLSTDGPDENVIKIKPPLAFGEQDADRVVEMLDEVLREDAVAVARR